MNFTYGMMTALTIITLFGNTPICNILILALLIIPLFMEIKRNEAKNDKRGKRNNHNTRRQDRTAC